MSQFGFDCNIATTIARVIDFDDSWPQFDSGDKVKAPTGTVWWVPCVRALSLVEIYTNT